MKKAVLIGFSSFFLFLNANQAFCIDRDASGIGMGLDFHYNLITSGYYTVYLPVILWGRVLIEPEFGYGKTSSEEEPEEASSGTRRRKSESTTTRTGLGVFITFESNESFRTHLGLRYGEIKTTSTYSYTTSSSAYVWSSEKKEELDGTYNAPTIKGEYFLADNFSINGEIQSFTYASSGTVTETSNGTSVVSNKETSANMLITLVGFRWYY